MKETVKLPRAELTETFEPVASGVDCELKTRGRYQICMELASGGMGTIYLALYRGVDGFERVVALKRMHPELAKEPHFVEMFFDEAQALARVQHPNVCALLDLGNFDDSYFLAMDYLEGEPLSAVFSALAMSPATQSGDRLPFVIARIFARLCDGLQAVHKTCDERGELMNLVHCDISPHNLFVLYDGTVRLMDFGAARAKRGMLHQERPGMARGKLPYMAPEQLEGADPDPRFDIWSIGVSMWELLTGASLFEGRTMKAIMAEVKSRPIPLASEQNPQVPVALAKIVEQTLMRDPDKRMASARQLSVELDLFVAESGECVPAAEIGTWLETLFGRRANERHKLRATARAIGDHLLPPSMRPFGELHSSAPAPLAGNGKTIEVNLAAFTKTGFTDNDEAAPVPFPAVAAPPETKPRSSQALTATIGAAAVLLLAATTKLVFAPAGRSVPPAVIRDQTTPNITPVAQVAPAPMATSTALKVETAPALPPPSALLPAAPAAAPAPETPVAAQAAEAAATPAPSSPPIAASATTQQEVAAPPVNQDQAAVQAAPTSTTLPPPAAASASAPPTPAPVPTPRPALTAVKAETPAPTPQRTQPKAAAQPKQAPAPPPSPSRVVAGGSVLVLTKPGPAIVIWEGREMGRSPVRVRLPAGNHRLLVRPMSGGREVMVDVHMENGWSSIAEVKLP